MPKYRIGIPALDARSVMEEIGISPALSMTRTEHFSSTRSFTASGSSSAETARSMMLSSLTPAWTRYPFSLPVKRSENVPISRAYTMPIFASDGRPEAISPDSSCTASFVSFVAPVPDPFCPVSAEQPVSRRNHVTNARSKPIPVHKYTFFLTLRHFHNFSVFIIINEGMPDVYSH